jgi:uncharacterized protein YdeI (BOF family)
MRTRYSFRTVAASADQQPGTDDVGRLTLLIASPDMVSAGNEPDRPRRRAGPRLVIVIVAAVVVVIAAVVIAVALGGGSGKHATANPSGSTTGPAAGTCRVPSGASPGTETPAGALAGVLTSLGSPDVRFTRASGGTTVYVYCYDSVSGGELGAASTALARAGYAKVPGQDPTQQVVFQKAGDTPYAVALTVTGTLDASQPGSADSGGLSVTWTDTNPN